MSKLTIRIPHPPEAEKPYDSPAGDPNFPVIHPKNSKLLLRLYDEARGENALEYEIWQDLELKYWAEWLGRMPHEALGAFKTSEEAEEACETHNEQLSR
jgi:hypothetical protein